MSPAFDKSRSLATKVAGTPSSWRITTAMFGYNALDVRLMCFWLYVVTGRPTRCCCKLKSCLLACCTIERTELITNRCRLAVDMKFAIRIHIHIYRFFVDVHGYSYPRQAWTGVSRHHLFLCLINGWTSVTAHLAHWFWGVSLIMQVCLMPRSQPATSRQSNPPTTANWQTWNCNNSVSAVVPQLP